MTKVTKFDVKSYLKLVEKTVRNDEIELKSVDVMGGKVSAHDLLRAFEQLHPEFTAVIMKDSDKITLVAFYDKRNIEKGNHEK